MNPEILVKLKNPLWGLLSCITSIVFTHYFFVVRHLYGPEPILYMDHAGHLAFSIIYSESIVNEFFASYGYSYLIHNGFPFLQYFSPGYFLIVYFFHLFGISYEIAYKIVLFLLMVFCGMVPYYVMRIMNRSDIAGFIGTVWFWIGMPSFILRRFNTGGITMLLGTALAIFFILYSLKVEVQDEKKAVLLKKEIFLGFFLFMIAFIHISAVIPIFLVISESILINATKERAISEKTKQIILFYLKIAIIAIGLLAFWLLPTVMTHSQYNSVDPTYYITSYEYSLIFTNNYIQRTYIALIAVGILCVFLYFRDKTSNRAQINTVFLTIINALMIVFLLPLTKIAIFQGVLTYRYLVFLEFGIVVIIAVFVDELRNLLEKYKKFSHTNSFGKIYANIRKETTIGLIILPILFIGAFPISGDNAVLVLYGTPEENYTEFTPDEHDLMGWIKENTTQESRILFQNSGHESGWNIGRGHAILYMALLTDRYYATGYTSQWYYSYAKATNFEDDLLYGEPLTDYTWDTLEPLLNVYNVEFIIVWTKAAIDFFNQTGIDSGELNLVYNNSKFYCFQYLSAPKSYIITGEPISSSDFEIDTKEISFNVANNISEDIPVILSFHDYPNWKVFINNNEVSKVPNELGLIQFILHPGMEGDELQIEVKWVHTAIEYISDIISWISLIGSIYLYIRTIIHRKKNG